jgi:Na+/melibiose symporter-like transporter
VDGVTEQVPPAAQPASTIFGIKVITGLIPGVAMLLGAIILIWFPPWGAYLAKV